MVRGATIIAPAARARGSAFDLHQPTPGVVFTFMVACFGLHDGNPSHFPGSHLVENRLRLDAFKLNRIGAFVEGTVTRLASGAHGCLIARHSPNILVNGNPILVTWDEQGRPWFECGTCGRRVK